MLEKTTKQYEHELCKEELLSTFNRMYNYGTKREKPAERALNYYFSLMKPKYREWLRETKKFAEVRKEAEVLAKHPLSIVDICVFPDLVRRLNEDDNLFK